MSKRGVAGSPYRKVGADNSLDLVVILAVVPELDALV
jgi:hypothetical protein